jgi:hypothetical protein
MSKTIFITLNNSGSDLGPYDLTLINGVGGETAWSANPVTKAVLTAGYQMTVPDNIVKVKVKSKTCTTYVELIIPTTQCPCTTFNFIGDSSGFTTFEFYKCNDTNKTTITIGDVTRSYCVDRIKPITVNGPGDYENTEICCTP